MDGVRTENTFALYSCATANHSAKANVLTIHMQLLARVQLTRLPSYIVLRYIVLHQTNHMEKIYPSFKKEKCTEKKKNLLARMNRQPPMHHPLEACDQ
jgi:hypothetical protein